jgi:hypothetical protein
VDYLGLFSGSFSKFKTMKKNAFAILVVLISGACREQFKTDKVFDVHLHGSANYTTQVQRLHASGVYKVAVSTSWKLQQFYSSSDSLTVLRGLMFPCPDGKVPYSRQNCFENGEEWPSPKWVQKLMQEDKIQFLGEVLTQYYGISTSDTSMYPYYSLAEKYNVPVGIHTGSAGPDHGCPNFKEELGDPALLRTMLDKFPKLRVWIMHAGLPYFDETVKILKDYPQLYADISAINNPDILKPEIFSKAIQVFIEQGYEDRIMFGSDNGDIDNMINAVKNLPFLSDQQKEKILYKNAETFFARKTQSYVLPTGN